MDNKIIQVGLPPINLDPKGQGHLTRIGLPWLVGTVIWGEDTADDEALRSQIAGEVEDANNRLIESGIFEGLDVSDESYVPELQRRFEELRYSWESWARFVVVLGTAWLKNDGSVDGQSRDVLLWRLGKARTMLQFSSRLEELAWRGYRTVGVDDLQTALEAWDNRTGQETEDYWQQLIERNPTLIGLLFIGPVVIENGKAYVGGKKFDNVGGHHVDFLLRYAVGGNAALLEIKTPETGLLGRRYRGGAYVANANLAGAVAQVSTYRDSLLKEFNVLHSNTGLVAFNPTCLILAGNYNEVSVNEEKQRSFELFRHGQQGLIVITYDELFERVRRLLATLAGDEPT